MYDILFNLNDISLILVIAQCMTLAFLIANVSSMRRISRALLGGFLVVVGLFAMDTLFYWCVPLKESYFSGNVHQFFIFKFLPYLEGPLIYWYVRSIIYSDFKATNKEAIHLLPVLVFPFLLGGVYYSLGMDGVVAAVTSYSVLYDNQWYFAMLWSQHILVLSYGAFSYWMIYSHRQELKEKYSNLDFASNRWLLILVGGFLGYWLIRLTAFLSGLFSEDIAEFADYIGVYGNYYLFILISITVFFSLSFSARTKKEPEAADKSADVEKEPYTEGQVERVKKLMYIDQLYLNSELTLEQLSEKASLPTRTVSSIINRHFNKNFFEFVNSFRVDHAKELLLAEGQQISMLDVMADSGFNSKSAFNRFFKKYTGMTPTQYKSAHAVAA